MVAIGVWKDAEPGVRRRILQAQGRLLLLEVQFAASAAGYEHNHVHEQMSYCLARPALFVLPMDDRLSRRIEESCT